MASEVSEGWKRGSAFVIFKIERNSMIVKKIFTITLMTVSYLTSTAQDTLDYLNKKAFLTNQQITLTPNQVIENFKKVEKISDVLSIVNIQ